MQIRLLKAGKYPWGTIEPSALMDLARRCEGQIFIGQMVKNESDFTGTFDQKKVTHNITNVHFNPITLEVWGDVEFMPTPYGQQLVAIMKKAPKRVQFKPVYSYDDTEESITSLTFITANAIVKAK